MQKQLPGRDLGEPDPAAAERHDRHRVRLDHQQLRARQAGGVRDQLLLHRHALPGEGRNAGQAKLADLAGKQVVSTTGTTNFQIIRHLNEEQKLGIDLLGAKDHAESALMVQTGRAVAFAMDDILLYGLKASAQNPAELAVVGEAIQVEPYAIMVRKDDPAFKKLVDDTLAAMMKSGEFEALYKKWFQSPIPPKGINLNAPMSKELRDNLKVLSDKPAT